LAENDGEKGEERGREEKKEDLQGNPFFCKKGFPCTPPKKLYIIILSERSQFL
jgi:hypothetical protein